MQIFLIAFAVFVVALVAMSVGVLVGRARIQGSCGGLANLEDEQGNSMCEACSTPSPECRGVEEGRERERAEATTEA